MHDTQYTPGPHNQACRTRAAERKAVVLILVLMAAPVGGVLLAAKFFPWMLEPAEILPAYAATMQ